MYKCIKLTFTFYIKSDNFLLKTKARFLTSYNFILMKHLVYLLVVIVFIGCKEEKQEQVKDIAYSVPEPVRIIKQDEVSVPVYDFKALSPLLNKTDDKVRVINFWATWCKPCVAELPYFEAVNQKYKNKNVIVILVSLDFPKMAETKLVPFIKEKNIKSQVVLLDDTKQNEWIPKVSENWSGAIPATIIYNKHKRLFYERSFTQEELETEIQKFIK